MTVIKIFQGKSKPAKKKPGWQQAQAEHDAWLRRVQSLTLGVKPPRVKVAHQPATTVTPSAPSPRQNSVPSLGTFGGAGTKPVARPDVLYKDDPEMLARELKARERRFNTAPAYNKGPMILVSEEDLTAHLVGGRRR